MKIQQSIVQRILQQRVVPATHLGLSLTCDYNGAPLVVIESAIGDGFNATPEIIRAIAAALHAAANEAEARSATMQFAGIKRLTIALSPPAPKPKPKFARITRIANPHLLLDTVRKACRLMTDVELARLLGIALPTISRIRNGHLQPDINLLQRMQAASGLSMRKINALAAQSHEPTVPAQRKPPRSHASDKRSGTPPSVRSHQLLDGVRDTLQLKNDAKLAQLLGVKPSIISRIRNGHLPVGASILLRMHEVSGLRLQKLKSLLRQAEQSARVDDNQ
jgi:transcriptional regulator with XRE-family HTH domain